MTTRRTPNTKAFLTCMDCEKESPLAATMPEAREKAAAAGWQTGMRGQSRVSGWEEDFCDQCKVNHPRTYCTGYRSKCRHRSLYTITRPADGKTVHACGSHLTVLVGEMIPGGKLEITETPI